LTGTARSSPAICLGCGCACDDIALRIEGGRIAAAGNACQLGLAWFGDGVVPSRVAIGRQASDLLAAVDAAAQLLVAASRPLVYLCPDLTLEAQRQAIGLADLLRARLDSVTSSTAARSILAAQEGGRASATLGEVRHRADVIVFWGVDPDVRYPRYRTRYAPDAPGLHLAGGRAARTVVAVDVGDSRGPADADVRVTIAPEDEVATLMMLRQHRGPETLLQVLGSGRYVVFVADTELDEGTARDHGRAAALIALTQALNEGARAALSSLRAGGNRSGADACMTAQTGYPMAVDFARGYPRYRPYEGAARWLERGEADAIAVIGASAHLPNVVAETARRMPCVVLGPRASEGPLPTASVVIDTGVAGIHEGGTALRMDEVPLPVSAAVTGPPAAVDVVREIAGRVRLRRTESQEVAR
jgi:formylmethanofuran dehydrogenase subunit B